MYELLGSFNGLYSKRNLRHSVLLAVPWPHLAIRSRAINKDGFPQGRFPPGHVLPQGYFAPEAFGILLITHYLFTKLREGSRNSQEQILLRV